jgi:hypothetical protein
MSDQNAATATAATSPATSPAAAQATSPATSPADQGTQAQVQANGATADTPAKLYATKAEAEAAKPSDAPKSLKPMEVSKAGTVVGWVLGRGYDHALAQTARINGYTVSTGNTPPVTKEAVAARLSEFSDDELAAMGLTRKKGMK